MRVKYRRAFRAFWREEMPPFLRSLASCSCSVWRSPRSTPRPASSRSCSSSCRCSPASTCSSCWCARRSTSTRQKELSDQYLEMNIGLAAAMVVLLDSKDEYTAQHSAAVAMYCRDIATAFELPEEEAEALHLAGLLHDLGKVGVPDAVLRKTTARSTTRSGSSSVSIPRRAPRCSRTWSPTRKSPTSSATTTSGWTAAATRAASSATRSPSSARSWRSPTPTTR